MSSFLYQRPLYTSLGSSENSSHSDSLSSPTKKNITLFNKSLILFFTLSLLILTLFILPYSYFNSFLTTSTLTHSKWRDYSLIDGAKFVAKNGTLIVCAVSGPYLTPKYSKWRDYSLIDGAKFVAKNGTVIVCAVNRPYVPFLSNWLISVKRMGHHEKVLVIAEDYATLDQVNERWPGHAVLVPPAPESQEAHKFGSQGFFNFTSRRPRHLLQLLELGYNVMYNDVDMVWLADPFPYMKGEHDVYFTDDMTPVKPLDHSHDLPPVNKKGRTYICSCMIFLRPTNGAKLVMKKWIEELEDQPWSRAKKANDQPGFNWALMKTAGQVDLYLLPQAAFPTGGLYFKNKTWVKETKGKHVIIHNNYIIGFEKKIKRFRDYGFWLVDDHADESPLGRL